MRHLQLVTTENQETIKQLDLLFKISNGTIKPELNKPEIETVTTFMAYLVDDCYYTPLAYKELTLQMCTGDFHTHTFTIVNLNEQDYTEKAISLNDFLDTYVNFDHPEIDYNEYDSEY